MHATDSDRSPGSPSFKVTTRRRLMPHGTVILVLACGDAGVALDAALGVAERISFLPFAFSYRAAGVGRGLTPTRRRRVVMRV